MCLPWNHRWVTIEWHYNRHYLDDDDLPYKIHKIVSQRCTHCGKEIVRKYRV